MARPHCLLDVMIRLTFEWREVANLLATFGLVLPDDAVGDGERIYALANDLAHGRRRFRNFLIRHFRQRFRREIRLVSSMTMPQIEKLLTRRTMARHPGLLWALASDERPVVVKLGRSWALRGR